MPSKKAELITPYGGQLVDLFASAEQVRELHARAGELPSIQISERAACDLEMLAVGGFSPLDRFMGKADYERVLSEMRLADGHLFPIPVTLPVQPDHSLHLDRRIALRDSKNDLLAIMDVDEIYPWNRDELAERALGTRDLRHPLVAEMQRWAFDLQEASQGEQAQGRLAGWGPVFRTARRKKRATAERGEQ